jgi:hypothetical protein
LLPGKDALPEGFASVTATDRDLNLPSTESMAGILLVLLKSASGPPSAPGADAFKARQNLPALLPAVFDNLPALRRTAQSSKKAGDAPARTRPA